MLSVSRSCAASLPILLALAACSGGSGSTTAAFGAQVACEDAVRAHVDGATGWSFTSERRTASPGGYVVTGSAAWTWLGSPHQRSWSCTATRAGDQWTVSVRFV